MNEILREDPQKVVAMIDKFGFTEDEDYGFLFDIANAWMKKDVTAAAAWVLKWPHGTKYDKLNGTRDNMLSILAREHIDKDPETAIAWALEIANPTNRKYWTRDVVLTWKRKAPDAPIRDFLESSEMPDDFKKFILKYLEEK